ncbi:hypothetical protein SRB17_71550 [Streptomyces sp. RB17]|nr:hypothetical protein [Streptomyces sp. RB17]
MVRSAGRKMGRAPTPDTGEARIDAWVMPPGESGGCRGVVATVTPSYAYDVARGAFSSSDSVS